MANNCSFHGQWWQASISALVIGSVRHGCICDTPWLLSDCSRSWNDYNQLYEPYRCTFLVAYTIVALLACWRFWVVLRNKTRRLKRTHRRMLTSMVRKCRMQYSYVDMQLASLFYVCCCSVLCVLVFVDPLGAQGWYSPTMLSALYALAGSACLMACAFTLRFFVQLRGRLHLPSRKVRNVLDIVTLVFVGMQCVLLAFTFLDAHTIQTLSNIATAAYIVLLIVGSSVYSIGILRDMARSRNTDQAHHKTLVQLIGVIRGGQMVGTLAIALMVMDALLYPGYIQPEYTIALGSCYRSLQCLTLALLLLVMGHTNAAMSSVAPAPHRRSCLPGPIPAFETMRNAHSNEQPNLQTPRTPSVFSRGPMAMATPLASARISASPLPSPLPLSIPAPLPASASQRLAVHLDRQSPLPSQPPPPPPPPAPRAHNESIATPTPVPPAPISLWRIRMQEQGGRSPP